MRPIFRSIIAALALIALTRFAMAVELVNTRAIAFGAIVSSPAGGTVTVTAAGSRSCSLGLTCLPQSVTHPARFTASGTPYMNFVINLPLAAALVSDGGSSLAIENFESSFFGDSGTLGPTGQASFTVGATLRVEPGTVPAAYSGTFNITVAYQ